VSPDDALVVFCTLPAAPAAADGVVVEDLAGKLARELVALRVCACAQVLPGLRSFYEWQGKVECAEEQLLLCKTSRARFDALAAALQARHPYSVPQIVAVPVHAGLPAYLAWLAAALGEEFRP
jgi:periplasmic divalent cation tolerance protein